MSGVEVGVSPILITIHHCSRKRSEGGPGFFFIIKQTTLVLALLVIVPLMGGGVKRWKESFFSRNLLN